MKTTRAIAVMVFLLMAVSAASADTVLVKPDGTGDFATIQAAVDSVSEGDVIELADGTFIGEGNRDVIVGKAITIRSVSGDPDLCIVDCGGWGEPHVGFVFADSLVKGADGTLENLTITQGFFDMGGGILCIGCSPTIRGCKVIGNAAIMGGGIGAIAASPVIIGCEVSGNLGFYLGGGMGFMSFCSAVVESCLISGNMAAPTNMTAMPEGDLESLLGDACARWIPDWLSDPDERKQGEPFYGGGGVAGVDSSSVAFTECRISENVLGVPLEVRAMGLGGAGVSFQVGGSVTFLGCDIELNRIELPGDISDMQIAGIGAFFLETTPSLERCAVRGNVISGLPSDLLERRAQKQPPPPPLFMVGGGICDAGGQLQMTDCLVTDNFGVLGGGLFVEGWEFGDSTSTSIRGTLIARNGAHYGGGVWLARGVMEMESCTVTGNGAEIAGGVFLAPFIAKGNTAAGIRDLPKPSSAPWRRGGETKNGLEMIFENTILWGNCALDSATSEGAFYYPASFECCDVDSGEIEVSTEGLVTWVGDNLFVDPMFCSAVECSTIWQDFPYAPDSNFRLDPASPCAAINSPVCGLIGALGEGCSECVVRRVPIPYPTIQAGIDAAQPCDTVLVACGTYYESGIDMKSGIYVTSETGEPDCVTITGQKGGMIFSCMGVDDAASIVGFTLTGGSQGAMYCWESSLTVRNCLFTGNTVSVYGGGALHCHYASPVLEHCDFVDNVAAYYGGAVYVYQSNVNLTDCTFSGNSCDYDGGGMHAKQSTVVLTDCRFMENTAEDGGGLYSNRSAVTLEGCVFWGNMADGGGGLRCYWSDPVIRSCTFAGNVAPTYSAMFLWSGNRSSIENTIIAFNGSGDWIGCYDDGSIPSLVCCDVYGNSQGDWIAPIADQQGNAGNMSNDPLFCDLESGDCRLELGSPCADAPGCGLIGALAAGCEVTRVVEGAWEEPAAFRLESIIPNPFNPSTEITFSIPSSSGRSEVTLAVYNALGQRVRRLVNEELSAGVHRAFWDGRDENGVGVASGIYFCNLRWGGESETKRMVLLK